MVRETVTIGNDDIRIRDQVIGLAEAIDIPLLNEVGWDGILGLAYPNRNLREKGIMPVVDSIIQQELLHKKQEKNQFAYYLGNDRGAITFGGADMKYKLDMNEEFKWAPIAERNYWTVTLIDIRKYYYNDRDDSGVSGGDVSGKDVLCLNGCNAVVDTGTYLIYGPSEKMRMVMSDMKLSACGDKHALPILGFVFKGFAVNGKDYAFELKLTPEDYVLEFENEGGNDCVVGFSSDDNGDDNAWTLGQVFLKAYYTVFDRETEAVGFVRSNPQSGVVISKEGEIDVGLDKENVYSSFLK